MQTNSTILNSNNNNNNNNKNVSTKTVTTDGGQFIFKSGPVQANQPNHSVLHSMSPALGASTAAASTTVTTAGLVTMTKTLNQGQLHHQQTPNISSTITTTTSGGQNNIAGTPTMLPAGVQIVNMRPGAPTTIQHASTQQQQVQQQQQQQQQMQTGQRTVATVQPRVVIGSHQVVQAGNNRQAQNSVSVGDGKGSLG